jgi:hypothetical protein
MAKTFYTIEIIDQLRKMKFEDQEVVDRLIGTIDILNARLQACDALDSCRPSRVSLLARVKELEQRIEFCSGSCSRALPVVEKPSATQEGGD